MDSQALSKILTHLKNGTLSDELILQSTLTDDPVLTEKIHDLKCEFEAREQTCKRMEAVFGSSPQPIIITDDQYKILSVNPSFITMSGLSEGDLINRPLSEAIPSIYQTAVSEVPGQDSDGSGFIAIDFPAGRKVLDQYTNRVPCEKDQVNEIILIFKDITIRVSAQDEAEQIRQKLLHDYGERVKEQKLFYSTASLIQDDSRPADEVLLDIVQLIPPGWQYPDITAASIRYDCSDASPSAGSAPANLPDLLGRHLVRRLRPGETGPAGACGPSGPILGGGRAGRANQWQKALSWARIPEISAPVGAFCGATRYIIYCEQRSITSDAMKQLLDYDWPGNIRELGNTIERSYVLSSPTTIRAEDLSLPQRSADGSPRPRTMKDHTREIVVRTLEECGGNRTRTAEVLDVSLRWLHYKLNEWKIDV